jgi:D-threonine aldolase
VHEALIAATAGVSTPALVADLPAVERNITRMAEAFAGGPAKLRPHFKAHKCTELMRRQLAAGNCVGVTCATAWEAEVLAASGFDDVLVANQVADPRSIGWLVNAARHARLTVCVDDPRHLQLLAATGEAFDFLVEVNVGQDRSGLPPGSDALLELARGAGALRFRGLQGYEGHAVLRPDRDERAGHVRAAGEILATERARLEAEGVAVELVSGGGTGTYDLAASEGVLDEVQAGSYVLMDATYGRLGLPFEQALFCRATVISRQGDRVVLDAGLKALSREYGLPRAEGIEITSLADEHATGTTELDLRVGDAVLLVPAHVDPTVNLHPAITVVAEDGATERWPVDGRR